MAALPSKILSCLQRPPRSRFHLQPENSVLPQPSSISRTQLGPTLALSFLPLFSLVLIEQSSTDNHPRVKHKQVYPVVHVIKLKMVTGGSLSTCSFVGSHTEFRLKLLSFLFRCTQYTTPLVSFQRFVPNFIPVANLAVSLGSSGRQKMSSGTLCGTPGPGRCLHPYIASPNLASP
ncbi:hypothetical protein BJV77DRAFT_701744 [Russula vinacea]|nr:hypothetical protein BJV77DRAFT_701744 [Russula vinacea]